jgi:hypothetical protein
MLGASSLLPWVVLALGNEDTEALESPLALSVARQLTSGPWGLYGPYGGGNPLVLIHPPLYYRLAALAAWPAARLGLDPVVAALAAGRSLSAIGLIATLVAACDLARLAGTGTQAGLWAALLLAATPVFGGLPFECRPDMLGVGVQTTGVLLVVASLLEDIPRASRLTAAFVCFGLAACIKQQFVVAPAICTVLLVAAWLRGRIDLVNVALPLLTALAIVFIYYSFEEWASAGRMSRSVFVATGSVPRIHPADWLFAANILLALIWKCVGLILLAAAALAAKTLSRPGTLARFLSGAGACLIAAIAALTVLQLFVVRMGLSALVVAGLLITMSWMIATGLFQRRLLLAGKVDQALAWFCAGEVALTAILSRLSTGAWFNYAILAVVFGCIIVARALARSSQNASSRWQLMPAALAVITVPAFAFTDTREVLSKRAFDRAEVTRLLDYLKRPADELFFVDRPGDNRVHGRLDLVYDPWLYPVFESIGLAEPRSVWLAGALEGGTVQVVISGKRRPSIDGIPRSIPKLGYRAGAVVGPFFAWLREPRSTQ